MFGVDMGPVMRPKGGRSVGRRAALHRSAGRFSPSRRSPWSSRLKLAAVSRQQTGSRSAGLQNKSTAVVKSRVTGSFWVNFP